MNLKKYILGISIGLAVALLAVLYSKNNLKYFLLVIAFILSTLPFIIGLVIKQKKQKEKEEMFLAFSRDLVESVKSGTPISKSIINVRNRNYGELSKHVKKLANQITLGIPLSEALKTFAYETKSPMIRRAINLISEAERAGGKIENILNSVTNSVNQTEELKKERKSAIANLVTQGYLIFIVFLIIMLVLEFKIFPLISNLSSTEGLKVSAKAANPEQLAKPLFILILVQSFFTGLVVGKISEGDFWHGLKHSFILLAVALIVTTGSKALIG